jgi:hypothetical protein
MPSAMTRLDGVQKRDVVLVKKNWGEFDAARAGSSEKATTGEQHQYAASYHTDRAEAFRAAQGRTQNLSERYVQLAHERAADLHDKAAVGGNEKSANNASVLANNAERHVTEN